MSFDAGFGMVVWVRGSLVRDVVSAIHFNQGNAFTATVSRTFNLPGVSVTVTGDVSVDAPVVALRRTDGATHVDLTVWARLTVTGGGVQEQCVVKLTAEVLAPFAFDPPATPFRVQNTFLDLNQFTVLDVTVGVPWVSPDPAVNVPQLQLDPTFRDFLVETVRPLARNRLRIAIPVDIVDRMVLQASADLILLPNARPAAAVVHDDCLAICVDLFDGSTLISPGNVNALEQPWQAWADRKGEQQTMAGRPFPVSPDNVQIVVAVNAGILQRYATLDARLQVEKALGDVGPDVRIDSLAVTLGRGEVGFTIAATAQAPDPLPAVSGSGLIAVIPMHDYVHLLRTDADFSSSGLVEIFDDATGLLTGILRSMLSSFVLEGIRRVNFMLPQPRVGGDLPVGGGAPGNAKFAVKLEGLAADPSFALIGISARTFRDEFQSDPVLDDPDAVPSIEVSVLRGPDGTFPDYPASKHPIMGKRMENGLHFRGNPDFPPIAHIRDRNLRFTVADHAALSQIAALRLRWSLMSGPSDTATAQQVFKDSWLDEPLSRVLDVDLWDAAFNAVGELNVRVEWYLPPHDPGRVIASDDVSVPILDRFHRTQSFARWLQHIQIKMPVADESGMVAMRFVEVSRRSAVHKIAITERCRFSDAGFDPRFGRQEEFDALPPPDAPDLNSDLCAYCFPTG